MRKKLTVGIFLLLLLSLIACSQKTQPSSQQQAQSPQTQQVQPDKQNQAEQSKQSQATQPNSQSQQKVVGSLNSGKYHYPDCVYAKKIKPENAIWFSSPAEAKAAGYEPCKVCKPPS